MGKRKIFSSQKDRVFTEGTSSIISGLSILFLIWLCNPCDSSDSSNHTDTYSETNSNSQSEYYEQEDPKLNNEEFKKLTEEFNASLLILEKKSCVDLNSESGWAACLGALQASAMFYEKISKANLANAHKRVSSEKAIALAAAQKTQFPKLRDKFGPIFRKTLKESGVQASAKTTGDSYSTLVFISSDLVNEEVCKNSYLVLRPMIDRLRFKRVECYKKKSSGKFTYVSLTNIGDNTISIWNEERSRYGESMQ